VHAGIEVEDAGAVVQLALSDFEWIAAGH